MLSSIVASPEMSFFLQEEAYIRLIQCFLQPSLMLQQKETPIGEAKVLGPDGRPQVHQHQAALVDPIYQLFVPDHPNQLGIILLGRKSYEIII